MVVKYCKKKLVVSVSKFTLIAHKNKISRLKLKIIEIHDT